MWEDIHTIPVTSHPNSPHILERLASNGPIDPKGVNILENDESNCAAISPHEKYTSGLTLRRG
jgi:hypothetical protein